VIFPKTLAGKVARCDATMTVRPVTTSAPKVGDRRCVKPSQRGDTLCHITITGVEQAFAGDITFKQARACGFKTTNDWRAAWVRQHDAKWIDSQEIATGADGVVDVDRWMTDTDLLPRFNARHARRLVHVISFTLAVDTPRFLAHPTANSGDYTEQRHRAIDDLEVVDEMTQHRYTEEARKQRESFRRDLEIGRQAQKNARRDALFRRAA
jgi:hypothetical protein